MSVERQAGQQAAPAEVKKVQRPTNFNLGKLAPAEVVLLHRHLIRYDAGIDIDTWRTSATPGLAELYDSLHHEISFLWEEENPKALADVVECFATSPVVEDRQASTRWIRELSNHLPDEAMKLWQGLVRDEDPEVRKLALEEFRCSWIGYKLSTDDIADMMVGYAEAERGVNVNVIGRSAVSALLEPPESTRQPVQLPLY